MNPEQIPLNPLGSPTDVELSTIRDLTQIEDDTEASRFWRQLVDREITLREASRLPEREWLAIISASI